MTATVATFALVGPGVADSGFNNKYGDPTAEEPLQLRSERSGKGEGRTYHLQAVATFDNGTKECTWSVQVVVPHDMRGGADRK